MLFTVSQDCGDVVVCFCGGVFCGGVFVVVWWFFFVI